MDKKRNRNRKRNRKMNFNPAFFCVAACLLAVFFCTGASKPSNAFGQQPKEPEAESITQMLAKLPMEDYENAISYGKNKRLIGDASAKDRIVLLHDNPNAKLKVYGYSSKESSLGMAVAYRGVWSYFDLYWDAWYQKPQFSVGDFDGDGEPEVAMTHLAGRGTGICLESLRIFEVQKDGTLVCHEMPYTNAYLKQELGQFIRYRKKDGIVRIQKDGRTVRKIDLKTSPDYKAYAGGIGIEYTTQIHFAFAKNKIRMDTKVLGCIGAMSYMDGVKNDVVTFDVIYRDTSGSRFCLVPC